MMYQFQFHSRKSRLKYLYTLLGLCIFFIDLHDTLAQTSTEKFIDIDGYIKYNAVSDTSNNYLRGAEDVLEIRFRYCNDYGMLLYQNGGSSGGAQNYFFALGVNAQKIYLEWRVSSSLIELYIGEGNLQPNTSYSVIIYNLGTPFVGSTFATINNQPVTVDFLTPVSQGGLDMSLLAGDLFVGGYESVNDLRVNTERLNGYLVSCVQYIRTNQNTLNLNLANEQYGVRDGCPSKFCAPPSVITVESSSGYLSVDHPLPPGTRTIIVLKFRTRASTGMLFYFGGPAYLTVYMDNGRLILGLNTKGEGEGAFSDPSFLTYNDGTYYSIRVTREGGVARMENDMGVELARVQYILFASPLQCRNINDCAPNPCLNGATCLDGIQDYTCQCTIEFNKGSVNQSIVLVPNSTSKISQPPEAVTTFSPVRYLFSVLDKSVEQPLNMNHVTIFSFSFKHDSKLPSSVSR
ncbi:uncharacterized protein LOC117107474 [Anneissia japonica]|uniref:uncharacterized protein LOC117107474 n=1 Tax=Anneissia japonica TaxID=1529436 RepID=UPI00142578AC|nr:uncharacterized protein LOC117107474 [Anneissia japonica]